MDEQRRRTAEAAFTETADAEGRFTALRSRAERAHWTRQVLAAAGGLLLVVLLARYLGNEEMLGEQVVGWAIGVGIALTALAVAQAKGSRSAQQPLIDGLDAASQRALHRALLRGDAIAEVDREIVADYAERLRTNRWFFLVLGGGALFVGWWTISFSLRIGRPALAVVMAVSVVGILYYMVLNFRLYAAAQRALRR